MLEQLRSAAVATNKNEYEIPAALKVVSDAWDINSGLLNGQLKKVRRMFVKRYASELSQLNDSIQ